MKRLFFALLINLAAMMALNAQQFNTFKVGISLGPTLSASQGYGAVPGGLFTIEPAYRISDAVAIGFRYETALNGNIFFDEYPSSIVSYTLNGQYYLNAKKFRPFVGAGAGLYRVAILDFYSPTASKLGCYPRVGFDAGQFSLALEYNLIAPSNVSEYEIKHSYFGFRIGGFFGGRRKLPSYTS